MSLMVSPELTIAVLPAGRWGLAFGKVVADSHYNVNIYLRSKEETDRFNDTHRHPRYFTDVTLPNNVVASSSLEQLVSEAEILVLAIPSAHARSFYREIKPFDNRDADIICLTKGLEEGTNLKMSDVLEEENPGLISRFTVISGPNFASEIIHGLPAFTVAASEELGRARLIQETFTTNTFRIYAQNDLTGIQLGGACKNVIAIAAGASDGLGFGENARAGLITRGLEEIKRLGIALGGQERTFDGLSGQGDLWLTCTSPQSRNHELGFELAKGKTLAQLFESGTVYEGYFTAKAMIELAKEKGVSVPIAEVVYEVLYQNLSILSAVGRLRGRTLTIENDHLL